MTLQSETNGKPERRHGAGRGGRAGWPLAPPLGPPAPTPDSPALSRCSSSTPPGPSQPCLRVSGTPAACRPRTGNT
eukprot:1465930-Rhodomonas_salina.2